MQHPEHQLSREVIIESVFAFALESDDRTLLRRIYESARYEILCQLKAKKTNYS